MLHVITAYLIHSKATSSRKTIALQSLQKFTDNILIIKSFDAVDLTLPFLESVTELSNWQNQIDTIKLILLDNNYSIQQNKKISNSKEYLKLSSSKKFSNDLMSWLSPRMLSPGEISVNLKHFSAITAVANGHEEYGLIAEDDVLENPNYTSKRFKILMDEVIDCKLDYLDMAGGCNLYAHDVSQKDRNLIQVNPPRTRTNAAYLISKYLADILVNKFLPFSMPIDWHLTFLMNTYITYGIKCAWTTDNPLLHGSEMGMYKSWRH